MVGKESKESLLLLAKLITKNVVGEKGFLLVAGLAPYALPIMY